MTNTLTSDDPRYREMFDVAKEAHSNGGQVFGDLTPAMNALRERAPVLKGSLRELLNLPQVHQSFDRPRPHFALLSFKVCDRAFRDNLLFSSEVYRESPGVQSLGRTILEMTGEEHVRYRSVVQPMFVRPKARTWWQQNWIQEAVDVLLDRMRGEKRADLNLELCARLPMHVVTRGIGMSGEEALTFRDHLLRGTVGFRNVTPEQRKHSAGEVARMLKELIAARRATPADDVVTSLINNDFKLAEGGTRKLTDEEIFGYCRLIILAGGGTTWRQLGITIHALLTNHAFWEACCANRTLLEQAVNESVRWCPTDPTFPRLVMKDVEVEGVLIAAGSRVDICLGAANRDPQRWDDPDVYDIFRTSQTHIGFAIGPHQCLGMNVAKQEMITALSGLMDRFPRMQLDPHSPAPQLLGGLEQRGMSALPVCLV